ncbi:MAG: glycosyl transferase family 4 [archaeon]|nr:glycosyl transferase family 4 [archaeon]
MLTMMGFVNSYFVVLFSIVFVTTWLLLPWWIKTAKKAGLVGKDIHKVKERNVAEMGGIIVLLGFIIGIIGYIALRIFVLDANSNIVSILAVLVGIFLATIIGIIDDVLGWKIGLKQWQKPVLTLLVATPIMAVNAGTRMMSIPLMGNIDLGLVYPLIIIPILIAIGTNGFNMLAGYNGLEASQGIIILTTLAYYSYITSSSWLSIVALCMVAALGAFLFFNKYPAKIFPGDTLTYSVGGLAAMIAIMANLEKIFIILFIPYVIEFFLKLRGSFKKESFARVQENGTLVPRYKKIYGLENLSVLIMNKLKIKTTEQKVVFSLYCFQLLFVLFTFIL